MDIFVSVLLPLGLVFIMFSLGVGLTSEDFLRVGRHPRAFFIGAVHQIFLLPVIAYTLILVFGFTAEIAVGIMILAACPGGAVSTVISKLAKWDAALSVTLTAVTSLTCVITVPLILGFAINGFMGDAVPAIDIRAAAITMFLLSVVPISLGVVVRALAPVAATTFEPILGQIAATHFAIIICAAITMNWGLIANNIALLGPGLLALVVLLTTAGFFAPRMLGCTLIEAKTISIETGVQNGTMGIGIAAILVGGGEGFSPYAIPSAVYGVVWYLTILPALFFLRAMD
jgi:BASS family bile acid:Na+ symporter